MKFAAWTWATGFFLVAGTSALGWLVRVPEVLVVVPSGLFSIGAGAFCLGRPGLVNRNRVLSCIFAGLIAVIGATQFPLRARFLLHKPQLNKVVEYLSDRKEGEVVEAEPAQRLADGTICVWMQVDGPNRMGFVKTNSPRLEGAEHEVELGDGWRFAWIREP